MRTRRTRACCSPEPGGRHYLRALRLADAAASSSSVVKDASLPAVRTCITWDEALAEHNPGDPLALHDVVPRMPRTTARTPRSQQLSGCAAFPLSIRAARGSPLFEAIVASLQLLHIMSDHFAPLPASRSRRAHPSVASARREQSLSRGRITSSCLGTGLVVRHPERLPSGKTPGQRRIATLPCSQVGFELESR